MHMFRVASCLGVFSYFFHNAVTCIIVVFKFDLLLRRYTDVCMCNYRYADPVFYPLLTTDVRVIIEYVNCSNPTSDTTNRCRCLHGSI